MWDSSLPGLIVEDEELERQRGLEQRESMLRDLGVVDLVYSLLQPVVTHSGPKRVTFPPSHGWVWASQRTRDTIVYTDCDSELCLFI